MSGDVVNVGFSFSKKKQIADRVKYLVAVWNLLKMWFETAAKCICDLAKNAFNADEFVSFSFDVKYLSW